MIDERKAEEKLMELADLFQSHYREKEYRKAKYCYDSARTIASFLELPEERMIYYFGTRTPVSTEGIFQEEKVQKVYEKCIFAEREERLLEERRRKERCFRK